MNHEEAVLAMVARAGEYADAKDHEMALVDERPLEKSAAIQRLVGTDNPETGKLHSGSSAEKVVESDALFLAHCVLQRQSVHATILARAQLDAAASRMRHLEDAK